MKRQQQAFSYFQYDPSMIVEHILPNTDGEEAMNYIAIQMYKFCPDVQILKLEHLLHMYQGKLIDYSRLPINFQIRESKTQKIIGVALSIDYKEDDDYYEKVKKKGFKGYDIYEKCMDYVFQD